MAIKPEALFYIIRGEQDVAGPYDLVQMAGLLRKKIITAETLTCREGGEDWKPFSSQPQYIVAKEMSPDATSKRLEALAEEAQTSRSAIPLPSVEFMLQAAGAALALLIAGAVIYFVARADTLTGTCLAVAGTAAALLGQCMICVRLMDEDYLTLAMVGFVPFFDVYYFLANFWDYLPYFCAKYIGGVFTAAALAGIACGNSPEAGQIKALLHFYGQ